MITLKVKDYQKNKLYDWERALADRLRPDGHPATRLLNVTGVRSRVYDITNSYSVPMPEVKQIKGAVSPASATGWAIIKFPPHMMERWIVAHESTHVILSYLFRNIHKTKSLSDHGPIFTGTYMKIMEDFLEVPLLSMIDTAIEAGLDFMHPSCCNMAGLEASWRINHV